MTTLSHAQELRDQINKSRGPDMDCLFVRQGTLRRVLDDYFKMKSDQEHGTYMLDDGEAKRICERIQDRYAANEVSWRECIVEVLRSTAFRGGLPPKQTTVSNSITVDATALSGLIDGLAGNGMNKPAAFKSLKLWLASMSPAPKVFTEPPPVPPAPVYAVLYGIPLPTYGSKETALDRARTKLQREPNSCSRYVIAKLEQIVDRAEPIITVRDATPKDFDKS